MTDRRIRDPNVIRSPDIPPDAPFWLSAWIRLFLETFEALRQVVIDHHSVVKPFISSQTGNYTTTGNAAFELVITTSTGTGTQTISLHQLPEDYHRVQVKRQGTAPVTVDTEGSETIDGAASVVIGSQYDAPLFVYTDDGGEWSIV